MADLLAFHLMSDDVLKNRVLPLNLVGFLGISVTWDPVSVKAKKVLCDNQWPSMGDFPQEGTGDLETCSCQEVEQLALMTWG